MSVIWNRLVSHASYQRQLHKRLLSSSSLATTKIPTTKASWFTDEHRQVQDSIRKFIDREINPFVDEWEEAGIFPAHKLFKKLGSHGFLGLNKSEEYGGSGLDFSYNVLLAEEQV